MTLFALNLVNDCGLVVDDEQGILDIIRFQFTAPVNLGHKSSHLFQLFQFRHSESVQLTNYLFIGIRPTCGLFANVFAVEDLMAFDW